MRQPVPAGAEAARPAGVLVSSPDTTRTPTFHHHYYVGAHVFVSHDAQIEDALLHSRLAQYTMI